MGVRVGLDGVRGGEGLVVYLWIGPHFDMLLVFSGHIRIPFRCQTVWLMTMIDRGG